MRAREAGVANCSQSAVGRQVAGGADTSTSFPRAWGSQRTNSVLSANRGSTIVPAVSALPPVPGLKPSIVASRVRTRGETRSTCDVPRRHPRHVPYLSFFASIPQRLYIDTSQFCALRWMAVPVSRGPMESMSVADNCSTRELSIPTAQMRRRTGSSVGNDRSGSAHQRVRRVRS